MPAKIRKSVSFSPSIFGSNHAITALRLFYDIMDIEMPPYIPGMRPDMSGISKAKLTKNRNKLWKRCIASKQERKNYPHDLVDMKYIPQALLVLAYLFMYKGVYITTRMRYQIMDAIEIEKAAIKYMQAGQKKQRRMQLNHLANELKLYKNGVARDGKNQLKLFHTSKGKKRAAKMARQKHQAVRKNLKSPMSEKDLKFFSEVWVMMRMIHGASDTKKLFTKFCPLINQTAVKKFAQSEGYLDEKYRPNRRFKHEMMALFNKRIT